MKWEQSLIHKRRSSNKFLRRVRALSEHERRSSNKSLRRVKASSERKRRSSNKFCRRARASLKRKWRSSNKFCRRARASSERKRRSSNKLCRRARALLERKQRSSNKLCRRARASSELNWSSSWVFISTFWLNSITRYQSSDLTRLLNINLLTWLDIDLESEFDSSSRLDSLSNQKWYQMSRFTIFEFITSLYLKDFRAINEFISLLVVCIILLHY